MIRMIYAKNSRYRRRALAPIKNIAFVVTASFIITFVLLCAGCSGSRVSYSVKTQFTDPRFFPTQLGGADIAVLPLMTSRGQVRDGEFQAEAITRRLGKLRPDLSFVSYEDYENGFPPRFNKRLIFDFYDKIFMEEAAFIKGLDSLWGFTRQPYLLVYALRDGAEIQNMDKSHFKHISVTCELWSRANRAMVWRSACRGVSDDKYFASGKIYTESIRRLAEVIPAEAPTTSGKPVPPNIGAAER